ncbi:MAG: pilus assembly protein [Gammaproteobacteria bacterium]
MKSYKFNITKVFISSLLSIGLLQPVSAATLSIPDSPLTVTTFTKPNIMFLLDDSGSMRNMTWDPGYVPTTTYNNWSPAGAGCNLGFWCADQGNVYLNPPGGNAARGMQQGGCAAGHKEGNFGGNTRCLLLPDPESPSTGYNGSWYNGNYLNYLYDTYGVNGGSVDISAIIPGISRMDVAKTVSKNVINSSAGMKFCLQSFENTNINVTCQPDTTAGKKLVTDDIDALDPSNSTPLAESYYEITRYFRGLDAYNSPISERCQKNYAIVVTDGYPTNDNNYPNNDPDDPTTIIPNWDGLAPATTVADFTNSTIPQFSDGFSPQVGTGEGASLFLDDMAKFAFDIDFRRSPITANSNGGPLDSSGVSFDATDYPQQNLVTFTVGFAVDNQMLQDAAFYGDGTYFQASNSAGLTTALTGALTDIQGRTSASASVAASSGFVSSDTGIYFGRYNSGTATGQLLYYKIDPVTGQLITSGTGPAGSIWDAGAVLPATAGRNIFSYNGTSPVNFKWSATPSATTLTAAQFATLGANANDEEKILNFIRGDQSCETLSGATCNFGAKDLRDRVSRLGTIVNSQPLFVGPPTNLYPDKWGDGSAGIPENCSGCEYSSFINKTANLNRKHMVYFGANDGMLHGIDAATGVEQFAYIPAEVIPNLSNLASINYTHEFYVDGSANVIDAFVGGNGGSWYSVLVGSLNKGGQGIYALDVTDPTKFNNPNDVVQWEFTDAVDADLGYTYARPAIVRMHNDQWAAVFGNGYNNSEADGTPSTTGTASLFIVFLEGPTGAGSTWQSSDYIKIDTEQGSVATPNGIASVTPVDIDGDKIADYIYGGDLLGNMWKFDVTNSNTGQWKVAYKQGSVLKPLFVAQDEAGVRQAITTRPIVANSGIGGYQLFFGSGRYLDASDASAANATIKEHFYGVIDFDDGSRYTTLTGFTKQIVTVEKNITLTDGTGSSATSTIRHVSTAGNNKPQNWFLVLPDQGERQTTTAVKRGNNIVFVTNTPSAATCDFGGTSWLMELDTRDGSAPQTSVFDLTGDGKVNGYDSDDDDNDESTPSKNPAGRRYDGKLSSPTILAGEQTDKKIMTTSAGSVQVMTEKSPAGANRRHSWRQLR